MYKLYLINKFSIDGHVCFPLFYANELHVCQSIREVIQKRTRYDKNSCNNFIYALLILTLTKGHNN